MRIYSTWVKIVFHNISVASFQDYWQCTCATSITFPSAMPLLKGNFCEIARVARLFGMQSNEWGFPASHPLPRVG
jgi:hypothetical protein